MSLQSIELKKNKNSHLATQKYKWEKFPRYQPDREEKNKELVTRAIKKKIKTEFKKFEKSSLISSSFKKYENVKV